MKFYIVGLAGNVYPVFKLVWDYANASGKNYEAFCYSLADVDKAIKLRCDKKAQEKFNEIVFKKSRRYRYSRMVNHPGYNITPL